MARMITTGNDVVSFLKEQHEQIKALFNEVSLAQGRSREKAFFKLRRLLAVHETAEEEIVHPAARRVIPEGESVIKARLHEEREAKKMLSELENIDPSSSEFDTKFQALKKSVIAHAEAEEREEFEPLGSRLEPARLERMRQAVKLAEAIAPTRPHPGVESAAANIITGPIAAMVDRMRDALSGKTA